MSDCDSDIRDLYYKIEYLESDIRDVHSEIQTLRLIIKNLKEIIFPLYHENCPENVDCGKCGKKCCKECSFYIERMWSCNGQSGGCAWLICAKCKLYK
jgi:hypothetical protein